MSPAYPNQQRQPRFSEGGGGGGRGYMPSRQGRYQGYGGGGRGPAYPQSQSPSYGGGPSYGGVSSSIQRMGAPTSYGGSGGGGYAPESYPRQQQGYGGRLGHRGYQPYQPSYQSPVQPDYEIDQNAVAAEPGGYQQWLQRYQQQRAQPQYGGMPFQAPSADRIAAFEGGDFYQHPETLSAKVGTRQYYRKPMNASEGRFPKGSVSAWGGYKSPFYEPEPEPWREVPMDINLEEELGTPL